MFHTNVQMCTTFLKRTYAYIHRHNAYAITSFSNITHTI